MFPLRRMRTVVVGALMVVLALAAVSAEAATTGKISGIVIDKSSKEPLPGASVQIQGTTFGAKTDLDGVVRAVLRAKLERNPAALKAFSSFFLASLSPNACNIGVN